MATTTNYGWTTPDDTALVKDGASAIRTLGSSIDSTLKTQIDAQIPDSLLTTTGDVIYASGANTPARLGIGTTGQVLQVSGGLPAWGSIAAGGQTLISTTTLSGTTANISSIPGTYNDLQLIIINARTTANGDDLWLRVNGATGSNYIWQTLNTAATSAATFSAQRWIFGSSVSNSVFSNLASVTFPNYANATTWKFAVGYGISVNGTTTTSGVPDRWQGAYNSTAAITSINVTSSSGGTLSGTAYLYGIK